MWSYLRRDKCEGRGERQGAVSEDCAGVARYGRGGSQSGEPELFAQSWWSSVSADKIVVIDVNINSTKPEANDGCAC